MIPASSRSFFGSPCPSSAYPISNHPILANALPNSVWDTGRISYPPGSVHIISDGYGPFDRKSLQSSALAPRSPCTTVFANELAGTTPVERGRALLDEIRRRKTLGEFGEKALNMIFLHGKVVNGELLLTDGNGKLEIPAMVLLHTLAADADGPDAQPILLSCCEAGYITGYLQDFRRPLLTNGGHHTLATIDARAVFQACCQMAESCWRQGSLISAEQWFDVLASTSGEPVHLVGGGDWLTHDLLQSSTSLHLIDKQQRHLYLRAQLRHGSVDDLAEALLLFGLESLTGGKQSMPVLHLLCRIDSKHVVAKILLLIAAGIPADQRDKRGNTPLHKACSINPDHTHLKAEVLQSRRRLARIFLANGADPLAENDDGDTPVDLAGDSGREELISLFDPDADISDFDSLRPSLLKAYAEQRDWKNVLSLLDELQQVKHAGIDHDGDISMTEEEI